MLIIIFFEGVRPGSAQGIIKSEGIMKCWGTNLSFPYSKCVLHSYNKDSNLLGSNNIEGRVGRRIIGLDHMLCIGSPRFILRHIISY